MENWTFASVDAKYEIICFPKALPKNRASKLIVDLNKLSLYYREVFFNCSSISTLFSRICFLALRRWKEERGKYSMGNNLGKMTHNRTAHRFPVQLLWSILVTFQDQHYFLSLLKLVFSMRKSLHNFPVSVTLWEKSHFLTCCFAYPLMIRIDNKSSVALQARISGHQVLFMDCIPETISQ